MLDFRTISDLGDIFPEIEKTEKSRQPVIYNFLGVAKEKSLINPVNPHLLRINLSV
ncbi:hypothetical protein [Lactimicrobium massiliense]|uniref:hypothetical protein n=1 Tax=Lactimicrobium massiliense TaxID=2161814 RepID=UPI0014355AFA|nr:hypothetical protein [Lactimicrobium massiliense]